MARLGVDYSFDPPTVAELQAAGATFAIRYASEPGHVKNLSRPEAERLSAAGLDVAVVFQRSKAFLLEGHAAGMADAASALDQAQGCGMPAGRPIYFALDIDPRPLTAAQWAAVDGYLDGAASVLGRGRVGIYGGKLAIDKVMAAGRAAYGWQTRSWSMVDGQVQWSLRAGLQQYEHNKPLGSGLVDWNRALADDFGQWKVGDPMAIIVPFADWRPLPEATSQPAIIPRTVIFHTAVGRLATTERFFREGTGVESHLMVGGPWDGPDLDGAIWQWMTLDRQADANLDANRFAISIETSDNAPLRPADIAPWSPKQLATLVRLGNWLADTFNIPRRQCPAWDAAGFGWHAMWGAPSHWTPSAGKECPGPARIAQLKTIVFPAIFAGRELEADDMFEPEDRRKLTFVFDSIAGTVGAGQISFSGTVESILAGVQTLVREGRSQAGALGGQITDTRSAVLGALALLDPGDISEEDLEQLAQRIAALDDDLKADAVLDALWLRLQPDPPAPG